MSSFGSIGDPSVATPIFVEAADPETLQDLVNAALGSINAQTELVTDIALAGAGDGHTYVVIIEHAPLASVIGGLASAGTAVRCYMGASPDELARSKSAAGAPAPLSGVLFSVLDEQLAGGAKGAVFMGMTVFGISSLPLGVNAPRARGLITSTKVLAGGNNVLAFDSLADANQFTLPAPQTMRYTGNQAFLAKVDASVTVEQTGAGDVTVQIVTDPNGAPTVVASTLTHVAAGGFDNVSVFGFLGLEPTTVQLTEIGLRVVAAGAGEVTSATLRVS